MLEKFADDIWIAKGSTLSVAGFTYPTRSVIVRLADGALWIWSPSQLREVDMQAIAALGKVAHLVAPNSIHHMGLSAWQAAYPEAQTYGPLALHKKRPDLRWDHALDDRSSWEEEITSTSVHNSISSEWVFFHAASQTVIFTDILQQFDKGHHKGWRAIVAKLDLMTGDRPQVPRKFRLGFRDRKRARAEVTPILAWQAQNLIIAHGAPVKDDAADVLCQSFRWLMGR